MNHNNGKSNGNSNDNGNGHEGTNGNGRRLNHLKLARAFIRNGWKRYLKPTEDDLWSAIWLWANDDGDAWPSPKLVNETLGCQRSDQHGPARRRLRELGLITFEMGVGGVVRKYRITEVPINSGPPKNPGATKILGAPPENPVTPPQKFCAPNNEEQSIEQSRTTQRLSTADCTEPAKPASMPTSPPVLTFRVAHRKGQPEEWQLHQAYIDELAETFPGVDVLAECKKALGWVRANDGREKTCRGMKRFLWRWMERAQNDFGHFQTRGTSNGNAHARKTAPERGEFAEPTTIAPRVVYASGAEPIGSNGSR
jgi:hypothetical protein